MAEPLVHEMAGLVLRLRETGESDLLIDLYTNRVGRITAIAKGARRSQKRFFGVLLTGHLLAARLAPGKTSELWRLDEAKVLQNYAALRANWLRWAFGAPVLELILRATAPHDPAEGLLSLADAALQRLCALDEKRQMAATLLIFTVHLAQRLGYGLCLEQCVRCGKPGPEAAACLFSTEGGLVCPECGGIQAREVSPGLLKALQTALALPADKRNRLVPPLSVCRQGLEFLADYMEAVCGHQVQSLGVALAQIQP